MTERKQNNVTAFELLISRVSAPAVANASNGVLSSKIRYTLQDVTSGLQNKEAVSVYAQTFYNHLKNFPKEDIGDVMQPVVDYYTDHMMTGFEYHAVYKLLACSKTLKNISQSQGDALECALFCYAENTKDAEGIARQDDVKNLLYDLNKAQTGKNISVPGELDDFYANALTEANKYYESCKRKYAGCLSLKK